MPEFLKFEDADKKEYSHGKITVYEAPNRLANFFGIRDKKFSVEFTSSPDRKVMEEYAPDGNVDLQYAINGKGQKSGNFYAYRQDRDYREIATYTDGALDGSRYLCGANKNVLAEQQYDHGKRVGHWTKKGKNGWIASERFYKEDGSETGFQITYAECSETPVSFTALKGAKKVSLAENSLSISENRHAQIYFLDICPPAVLREAEMIQTDAVAYLAEIRLRDINAIKEQRSAKEKQTDKFYENKMMQSRETIEKKKTEYDKTVSDLLSGIATLRERQRTSLEKETQETMRAVTKVEDKFAAVETLSSSSRLAAKPAMQ